MDGRLGVLINSLVLVELLRFFNRIGSENTIL